LKCINMSQPQPIVLTINPMFAGLMQRKT